MADPQAAVQTQLKNVQAKTGNTIADLHKAVAATGLAKHGEKRSWLMAHFKLGYGDAYMVTNFIGKPLPELGVGMSEEKTAAAPVAKGDPLDAIYAGAKAPLRPLHDAVTKVVQDFGDFEAAPKKSYISLRRKKQFAMLGPATKDSVEIGLNAKDLPPHERLKLQPPGSMCNSTTRIGSVCEIDAALKAWLKRAFEAAG